jgi:RHS repeat-associated protein
MLPEFDQRQNRQHIHLRCGNLQIKYNGGSSQSNGADYFYDGSGKRVKKIVGTTQTIFVYNAGGQLVAEYQTNYQPSNVRTSYLAADTLGSPCITTDSAGVVKSRHDYYAFGEEITAGITGRSSTQKYVSDNIRQKYTGYERDNESGLDYAQARYYSSQHGRFTSVDPLMASASIKNPQTFNRYSYALNSPYKFTDPLGLAATNPQCGNGGRCDTQADDLDQQQKEQEQKQKEQQQQSEQKKVDCPQKGYCLVYQEIGKQQTLSGDIVNGKPAYGVQRTFIFRVFKDGTPFTPSTAKGVTVEENVVKTEAFVLNPTTGKREPAPKEITDTVKDEKTDGPQALFTKEGKQTGDVQAFAATTKDKYDELAGTGLMSKDEVKFTVRVDGKEVASRTIISTKTLTNISVEIKPNIQPK